ncbi:hypothetical protein B0T14DRAFT_567365 [Immersiella caudata]|uniref:Uncharacterized protein n=1 Tax=Immersiella caudata TaxID=314043 RepID=A0AA39WS76_9PEZI|nr:hypothetical protein B0T14DRAFT_567365 [Immersiella caudata]
MCRSPATSRPSKGIPATETNRVGYWVCPPPATQRRNRDRLGWAYQQLVKLEKLRPASYQGVNDEDLQLVERRKKLKRRQRKQFIHLTRHDLQFGAEDKDDRGLVQPLAAAASP